ncbi:MAG TPA: hypothetical protein PLI74_01305 [Candidatus Kapabacteria bacterium]|nr:hypothetical protein [Candidatus Kapabacteria bacterium]
MKPSKISAVPPERYGHSEFHPVGIMFCYGLVSIIMTSLRDFVGRGFCVVYPPRPSDTPQKGNFRCMFVFVGCVWFLVDDGISSAGAI